MAGTVDPSAAYKTMLSTATSIHMISSGEYVRYHLSPAHHSPAHHSHSRRWLCFALVAHLHKAVVRRLFSVHPQIAFETHWNAAHNHAKAHEFVPVEGFRLKKPWALSVKPTCSTCNLRNDVR